MLREPVPRRWPAQDEVNICREVAPLHPRPHKGARLGRRGVVQVEVPPLARLRPPIPVLLARYPAVIERGGGGWIVGPAEWGIQAIPLHIYRHGHDDVPPAPAAARVNRQAALVRSNRRAVRHPSGDSDRDGLPGGDTYLPTGRGEERPALFAVSCHLQAHGGRGDVARRYLVLQAYHHAVVRALQRLLHVYLHDVVDIVAVHEPV